MTVQTNDNKFSVSKWIVDPTPGIGTHTTIAAALSDAVSGESIFVRPAIYIEDLTLKAGVSLLTSVGNENIDITVIRGKCSFSETGETSLTGFRLETNSDFAIEGTGANDASLFVQNCFLAGTNNTLINFTNSNSSSKIQCFQCNGDLQTVGIAYFSSTSAGVIGFSHVDFLNSGSSTTASTASAGVANAFHSRFFNPITTTGTAQIILTDVSFDGVTNTTIINHTSSTASTFSYAEFRSGTASAILIGAGSQIILEHCQINSSNANIVAGVGTLRFTSLISGGSGELGTTTLRGNQEFIGILRSPTQPAFLAVLPSNDNNVTGDGTVFQLGSVTALTEIFDQNGDFNTNGTFTAPVTGKYSFTGYFLMGGIINTMTSGAVTFITSNRTYTINVIDPGNIDTSNSLTMGGTIFADMDAGDTCTLNIFLSGEGQVSDALGDGTPQTFFSGYLVF